MPLQIVRNDITKMKVDALVNIANISFLDGGGIDSIIRCALGPRLLEVFKTPGGCTPGQSIKNSNIYLVGITFYAYDSMVLECN